MKTIKLKAEARTESGKGVARKLRVAGFVPAVFYGFEVEPVKLTVTTSDLIKVIEKVRSESSFIKLSIKEGDKKTERVSVLKDVQIDTIKRKPIHVDFYEIKMDREVTLDIPIILVGDPVGVEAGGELQQVKRELKVSGLPAAIPEAVELDISALGIGDSIKVSDVELAEGIKCLDIEDGAIATVAAKRVSVLAEAVEVEGEAIEGEETEAPGEETETSEGDSESE
ncbi:MAG: 50S ribosomal protein L25 [Deltaproteobacteria bacterium]|nr:50S ribosomal protein L25 [Deltaproteobacteria bacterium]